MTATNLNDLRGPAATGTDMKRSPSVAEINAMPREKQFPLLLEKSMSQIAVALPKHMTVDRMARLSLTAFRQTPALANCDPMSIIKSVIIASQMGLEIGIDGQAYLVPYRGECTLVPGWKGYVHLVNNAGKATIWTGAVFEGDHFDFQLGDDPYCRHRPTGLSDETKANLRFVYSVGKLAATGERIIEVWPVAKVIRHLARFNKVGPKHYALKDDTNFIAYARKVALLQVIKYLPKSVEDRTLEAAVAIDASGSSAVDLKDVLDGEWSQVAATVGESSDGGSIEDRTEGVDLTAGQQAAAIEAEEKAAPATAHDSAAAGAQPGPEAGTATAAAESPKTPAKRARRVIE